MNITFDMLNEGQKATFNRVVERIKAGRGGHITINGPAGTGKTTMTKFIINYLISTGVSGVMLAAPTHGAKRVLSKLAGMAANTIHSILKINPTTYEENMLFEQSEVPDMAKCRVLICDEASMYDRKLFQIIMASVPSWCLIIAIGDKSQIRPVEPGSTVPALSPFFTHKDFEQLYLTEVMRSNAPIIKVATDIRNGEWIYEHLVDGEGVHGFTSQTALRDFMMTYFENVKTMEDMFENRMLAFTNKSVDKLNSIIRRRIFQTEEPFIVGEVVVMQEPLIKELEYDGKKFSEVIFNNGQYVRILSCKESSDFIGAKGVPGEYMVRHWDLELETYGEEDDYYRETIRVIADEHEQNKFQFFLAKAADTYKNWNKGGKAPWKDFWAAKRRYHKVKALPCSTFHKAQGVSVDNCYVYTPCIHMADAELAQQLLYVGTTRARKNVYYV